MLTAIKPMLPTIQAVTLMAVYALLPDHRRDPGYSLMLAVGAIGIFTINFWTVLWKFAHRVDENPTVAMHPGSLDGLMNWAAAPGGFAGATSKALMLDTMLAMFMIGMPVLWTMMMAWPAFTSADRLKGAWRPGGKVRVNQGKLAQELRPVPLRGLANSRQSTAWMKPSNNEISGYQPTGRSPSA